MRWREKQKLQPRRGDRSKEGCARDVKAQHHQVTRTPNFRRAKQIASLECGPRHGNRGHSAGENLVQAERTKNKEQRTAVTPTGLLMEGDSIPLPEHGWVSSELRKSRLLCGRTTFSRSTTDVVGGRVRGTAKYRIADSVRQFD